MRIENIVGNAPESGEFGTLGSREVLLTNCICPCDPKENRCDVEHHQPFPTVLVCQYTEGNRQKKSCERIVSEKELEATKLGSTRTREVVKKASPPVQEG